MWYQRRKNDLEFIRELFGSNMKITGTILNIDTESGVENYAGAIGDPMAEDTLIIGDEDNNIILCFNECSNLCHKDIIAKGVHLVPHFDYKEECMVHKKQQLADVPERLINVIFQNSNIVHNITNNFNQLQISPRIHDSCNNKADKFMHTFCIRGGMMPLKNVKSNPEWKKEYENDIVVKRVHICKSCKNKAHKECCLHYSPENRSKITMVMGWSEQHKSC